MIDPLLFVLRFIFDFWWFLLPVLLIQIVWDKFKANQRRNYVQKLKWGFLEIKFPSGITRTPRAMEEIFNALHALHPDPEQDLTWWNLNIKGFVPKSYAFLIIAHDGQLKFYIRFPQELKDFIKTRFYSQYPEIQFEEINDPLKSLPSNVPNALFETAIYDVRLIKEDAYPLKTYVTLENLPPEQQIDPISTFSEAATQISNKEWLIFQILAIPTTPDNPLHGKKWIERGKKIVNKLIGKEEVKEPSAWEEIKEFIVNLLLAPFREPQWKTTEKKEAKEFNIQKLTPGERRVVELIQAKLSKLGYWCNFNVAYIATRDIYHLNKGSISFLISSILKNFSTEDLNGLSLNYLTSETDKHPLFVFILKKINYSFFLRYRALLLPSKLIKKLKEKNLDAGFILTSEELASIFHPPMQFVPPTGFERIPIREFPPPKIK